MSKSVKQKILAYMKNEIKTKGYPPTVREICSALNIKSTSTAHKDIASLVKQGFIRKDPSKPRALMIVDGSHSSRPEEQMAPEVSTPSASIESGIDIASHTPVAEVPVVGRIAAGTPILAEQNIEDSFPIPTRFLGSGTQLHAGRKRRKHDRGRYHGWGLHPGRTAEQCPQRRYRSRHGRWVRVAKPQSRPSIKRPADIRLSSRRTPP